jgi:hypothetical protein
VLDHTLDRPPSYPNLRVIPGGPGFVLTLFLGVALFALAEVFRAGSDLRELDEATI